MHVLIVDDEALARQRLRKLLENVPDHVVVGEADNGESALKAVEHHDPDLVLMDVKMPGMDGLEAARAIAAMDEPPALIFCTAYDDYALDAFDAEAVGYLVKPVTEAQLHKAIEKAQRLNKLQRATADTQDTEEDKRQHIAAKTRRGVDLIPLSDVACFIADQKYVTVMHHHGETLIDDTLKDLESDLAPEFIRVHRNALVAVRSIAGLERADAGHYEIVLKDHDYRPMVSRRHMSAVRALVNSL